MKIRYYQALALGLVGGSFLWGLGLPTKSWGEPWVDWIWCVGCMAVGSILIDVLKGYRDGR